MMKSKLCYQLVLINSPCNEKDLIRLAMFIQVVWITMSKLESNKIVPCKHVESLS